MPVETNVEMMCHGNAGTRLIDDEVTTVAARFPQRAAPLLLAQPGQQLDLPIPLSDARARS